MLKTAMADAEKALLAKASDNAPKQHDSGSESQLIDAASESASLDHQPRATRRQGKSVSPGDRLVRDWNGKPYIVDVIEEGFVFQAKVHKSLTAIARQITGPHWSGPRFFGL